MAFLSSMNIVASGLTAQQLRLDIVGENVTNSTTTRVEGGEGAYRRKMVVFEAKTGRDGFRRAMARCAAQPAQTAIVGDQIFTDIWGGNRAGVLTLLVKPIEFGTVFRALRYGIETPFRCQGADGGAL